MLEFTKIEKCNIANDIKWGKNILISYLYQQGMGTLDQKVLTFLSNVNFLYIQWVICRICSVQKAGNALS